MTRRVETFDLLGSAGRLEALWTCPAEPRAGAALVCHPHPQHGGTMHTKAVHATARALAAAGLPVLRFNFRGVGRSAGHYTGGPGEREDAAVALVWLRAQCPQQPLVVGGFSFGAWIAHAVGSVTPGVAALLAIAPPLGIYDFGPLAAQGMPILCVAGTRDPFCPAAALDAFAAQAPERVTVTLFDGAEHLLVSHLPELEAAVRHFTTAVLERAPRQ
jgi:alpha/beta superfamily hydrolase